MVNLAITPIVVRSLGPQDYGVVALSSTLFQFGIVVLTLGLPASITRQAIIEESGTSGAVGTVVTGAFSAAILLGIGAAVLPLWGPLLLPGRDPAVLIYPLISSLGLAVLQNAQSLLRAEERVASFVLLGASASVMAPLAGMATALLTSRSAASYLLGQSVVHLLVGISSTVYCLRLKRPNLNLAIFMDSLRVGLPTVPHQIAISSMTLILVSVAAHAAGLAAAGALQLGLLLGSAPMLILGALNNVWAPMIYRTSDEERQQVLRSTFQVVMIVVATLTTGFAILGPSVATIVAGPAAKLFPVFQLAVIASLGSALMAGYLANIHMVFVSGKTLALAITTPAAAFGAVGLAVLSYLAGPASELWLLALAVPLFQLTQLLISAALRSKRSDVSVRPGSVLLEALSIGIISAAAFFLTREPFLVIAIAGISLAYLLWSRRSLILPALLSTKVNVS